MNHDTLYSATIVDISKGATLTVPDAGLSTYSAKNKYQRKRPFMKNNEPTCTPDEEEGLRKDGSYPSGHTAIGWAWALILTEIAPDRADAILARGRAFGESRNVCNVHWRSDVVEGRFMGAAAVARLHADPVFQLEVKAAKAELVRTFTPKTSPLRVTVRLRLRHWATTCNPLNGEADK